MRHAGFVVAAALICGAPAPSHAIEGSAAAGPSGGTDIRSAQLPPPGWYGGGVLLVTRWHAFADGNGDPIPALSEARVTNRFVSPFLLYVPELQVFGGSIGFAAIIPVGEQCGRLFAGTSTVCRFGAGDLYLEAAWSRYSGTPRASRFANAFPIPEGLTFTLGVGVLVPVGQYNAAEAASHSVSIGNNIYDFAPWLAFTYVTPPILAEGTEVSAKLYLNNYLENPTTKYATAPLLDLDFAISERLGRFQFGVAGFYAVQIADDTLAGVRIPPDGRRAEVLMLGGVLAYDMPEYLASVKVKVLEALIARNVPKTPGFAITFAKKLQ